MEIRKTSIDTFNASLSRGANDSRVRNLESRLATMRPEAEPGLFLVYETELSCLKSIPLPTKTQEQLEYQSFCDKALTKWCGRQGRRPDLRKAVDSVAAYYEDSQPFAWMWASPMSEMLVRAVVKPARDKLLASGSPFMSYDEAMAYLMDPSRPLSSSGYSLGRISREQRKEWFVSNRDRITRRFRRILKTAQITGDIYPLLWWYREMHQKQRDIYGDDLENLVLEVMTFGKLLNTCLAALDSVFYCDRLTMSKRIIKRTRKWKSVLSVEGDYESMDKCISKELATEAIRKWCEVLDVRQHDAQVVVALIAALFEQALLGPDGRIWMGKHRLFSGLFITNGLECVINLMHQTDWYCSMCLEFGWNPTLSGFFLIVMGDDSALLLNGPNWHEEPLRSSLAQRFTDFSALRGLRANPLKQRVSEDSICFCKCFYSISPKKMKGYRMESSTDGMIPVPRYPLELVVTSICYPENGPSLSILEDENGQFNDPTPELIRITQALDNGYGDPRWESYVNHVVGAIGRAAFVKVWIDYDPNRDIQPNTIDWRKRVIAGYLGWSTKASPTVKLIMHEAIREYAGR